VFHVLALFFAVSGAALQGAPPSWLDQVAPVITPAEKKAYLSLQPEARREFEESFWSNKSITAEEYFKRLAYVDATFGSSRPGSGANTDPGRVYLSLGPPSRITRIPSSRIFVPLDIWYYDAVPGILNTELRLIFYQKNSMGFLQLYSPTLDTIRGLLLPQAGTRTMFGPNESITESSIRQNLKVGLAEDEVLAAAVNVAAGIKYSGNDEILGLITSPQEMLGKSQRAEVRSSFIVDRGKLDVIKTPSPYGGAQVDLKLVTSVQREIDVEVFQSLTTIYHNQLHLKYSKAEPVEYKHRLDLLPGSYRVMFTVDGKAYPYPLEVAERADMGEIVRVSPGAELMGRPRPFEFDGKQLDPDPDGGFALVTLPQPAKVAWTIRKGTQVLWKAATDGGQIAIVELPSNAFAPGVYKLEAVAGNDSRSVDFVVKREPGSPSKATVISFNANLAPASRFAFIGRQWLLRDRVDDARRSLQASLRSGITGEAQIELARVDASAGNLDAARERVRSVLAVQPNNFDALSVYAYIEAQLQDYAVAAELYRRALAVQDSPALRMALARLPQY
jgi:GWxTD domain-containing protein